LAALGPEGRKALAMYIGFGTILLILFVLLALKVLRRV
jgi:hypothetical protein